VTGRIEIRGVAGLPEITAGDDLGLLLVTHAGLHDDDIVVVTSKAVSKAEGRLVAGSRDEHLPAETVRLVASRGDTRIVETRHGFVLAAAGIDASNVPPGTVALLPLDPDASARAIRDTVRAELGIDIAVIISDTMGRPWRDGVIDTAIGAAGIEVLSDLRGLRDPAGQLLEATVIAVGDELASAAELVKGKLSSTPVAVIRGFAFTRSDPDRGARPLIRAAADDMFRLGAREAALRVVADSAPVSPEVPEASRPEDTRADPATVRSAIAALGPIDVALSMSGDGRTVSAAGEPLAVGIAVGRLLAALAAHELRGHVRIPPPGGSTVEVDVRRS
jgi:coenzyme F420-0:L-glutamate ligase / coenzyme F420-1:gamma-L-glutamate ligase